jgi:hypothetical protein
LGQGPLFKLIASAQPSLEQDKTQHLLSPGAVEALPWAQFFQGGDGVCSFCRICQSSPPFKGIAPVELIDHIAGDEIPAFQIFEKIS